MTVQLTTLGDTEFDRVGGRRAGVPTTDDEPGAGALTTARGNLPLAALAVDARIVGLTAHTVLRQSFRNPYDEPLEATYLFPLPPRAAVTAMRMTADDRVVEAELQERGAARERYEKAVEAGQRASIAEQERPDVFTMRVGNILPGERVEVELTTEGLLPYADDAATFRFPLVVAPRYIPGTPLPGGSVGDGTVPDTDAVPDASRITPPVLLPGFPNPIDLSVTVHVDAGGLPLRQVRSSLHTVDTERTDDGVRLAIAPGERADRDFVLRLGYGEQAVATAASVTPDEPAGTDGTEYGGATVRLTLLPPTDAVPPRPRDVVLLLDRSGSMNGWKMVAARRAAARIVDTLTDADRFAVLRFDHVVEHVDGLPEGLVAATDRSRYAAVEALARTDARGGTELLSPLTEALSLLAESGRDRVLVLVTDGQVGNEDQIVAASADRFAGVRVHTVGIDRAVNAGFLGRLATLGGGRCELVESMDRLDEAMTAIHRRISAPVLRDLRLTFDGPELVGDTLTPARMPDLFPGAPVMVAGRLRAAGAGRVRVDARRPDGTPWSTTAELVAGEDPAAAAVWARGRLRDLEDEYAIGATDRASAEARIVATSLRFGVLCRFTAYVAVDSRVVTEGGTPRRVTQPVELPSGWEPPAALAGGSGGGRMMPMAMKLSSHTAPPAPGAPAPATAPGVSARRARPAVFGGPGFAPGHRPPADPLEGARQQANLELRRLRALPPADDRRSALADLGTRLAALVDGLPDGVTGRAELAALVTDLRACDGDEPPRGAELDRLWQRTIDLLAAFAGERPAPEPAPRRFGRRRRPEDGTDRRGSFWR
ncbi:VIT domain-containing protein [Actinocatenispora sera]|uniref:Inter-alpha-trypsin inhibitor domain-containing protein n=1 Tax=Actinocatenispora sera TaxID=390989 RepID=A0A810L6A2_9ACTN|nr:VIT domain-containing protein [Actinocatenispora sera]BCJ30629.1 inter-alpha-trypsin inhibitor domain-containing protein [Actinocatenispora sera]